MDVLQVAALSSRASPRVSETRTLVDMKTGALIPILAITDSTKVVANQCLGFNVGVSKLAGRVGASAIQIIQAVWRIVGGRLVR